MTALADAPASPRPKPEASTGSKPGGSRSSFTAAIRDLFRDVKAVLTGKAPAPEPKPKRREEETQGGLIMTARRFTRRLAQQQFRKVADALRQPVVTSLFDHLYAPVPYSPEQERAAERFLHMQLDAWAREENGHGQQDSRAVLTPGPKPC